MKTEYGAVYDHFKQYPADLTEHDLHLLADAFHIMTHSSHEEQVNLLDGIQSGISNATNQTAQIGSLIDSTSSLITVVKGAIDNVTHPGNLIGSLVPNSLKSLFSRVLTGEDNAVTKVVTNLENKVIEAKANQKSITGTLQTSQKFLAALQSVGQLLNGNTTGFVNGVKEYLPGWLGGEKKRLLCGNDQEMKLCPEGVTFRNSKHDMDLGSIVNMIPNDKLKSFLGQYVGNKNVPPTTAPAPGANPAQDLNPPAQNPNLAQNANSSPQNPPAQGNSWMNKLNGLLGTAAAHLEHLADSDDIGRGRQRRSLYQQRENKQRLLRMANSMKRALAYINTVTDHSADLNRIQNHLYDLIEDGGAVGSAYIRGVTTLKCILLHQDCNVDTFVNRPVIQVVASNGNATDELNDNNSENANANGGDNADNAENEADSSNNGGNITVIYIPGGKGNGSNVQSGAPNGEDENANNGAANGDGSSSEEGNQTGDNGSATGNGSSSEEGSQTSDNGQSSNSQSSQGSSSGSSSSSYYDDVGSVVYLGKNNANQNQQGVGNVIVQSGTDSQSQTVLIADVKSENNYIPSVQVSTKQDVFADTSNERSSNQNNEIITQNESSFDALPAVSDIGQTNLKPVPVVQVVQEVASQQEAKSSSESSGSSSQSSSNTQSSVVISEPAHNSTSTITVVTVPSESQSTTTTQTTVVQVPSEPEAEKEAASENVQTTVVQVPSEAEAEVEADPTTVNPQITDFVEGEKSMENEAAVAQGN
jgi:hypothetical protein